MVCGKREGVRARRVGRGAIQVESSEGTRRRGVCYRCCTCGRDGGICPRVCLRLREAVVRAFGGVSAFPKARAGRGRSSIWAWCSVCELGDGGGERERILPPQSVFPTAGVGSLRGRVDPSAEPIPLHLSL
jgi:hypothetical protein